MILKKGVPILAFFLFAMLIVVLPFSAYAQNNFTVSGMVVTTDDIPLPGVNVIVDGQTNLGTSTDLDGRFQLNVPGPEVTLLFTYIGFQQKAVPVNGQSELNVVLEEDTQMLEELVVVGYGTTTKSDLTGSVAKVSLEEVQDIPANSVEGILQGRIAGLSVSNASQDPGAGSTVRIRGGSSLRGSNSPLLVVDGFPLGNAGDLKQINPEDIESVEVLKDASASAIYGSRGANGVIVITTKQAREGTTQISLKQQTTLSQFTSKLNLWQDPVLMAQLSNEGRRNGGFEPLYVGEENATGVYYPSVYELQSGQWPHNTQWDDIVFRDTPVSNNTTLSVASANDKTTFNLSGNYFTDAGVYVEDDYEKLGYNLRVSHDVFDNLKVSFNNILSRGVRQANGGLAYWRNPIRPVYNEDGSYNLIGTNDYSHPVAITENKDDETKSIDVLAMVNAEWDVLPVLRITSRLNYKYGEYVQDTYFPNTYTEAGDFNNGAAGIYNWQAKNIVSETFANYNQDINDVHTVGATVGYSYQRDLFRDSNLGAYDFVNETLRNENLGAGNPELNQVSNGFSETELVSGIARVNYRYDNRYLLTLTTRADGSSKFGANNKWAFFPSGAVSWNAHNEDFIDEMNFFNQLKFRVSYGISGNQGISPYQTLSRYGVSQYYNNGSWVTAIGPGYEVGRTGQGGIEVLWGGIPNPDLKWETTAQSNIGVDLAFFENRVNVVFDYYNKLTSDLLRERILPISSGYDRMWVNDGEIRNRGIELTIDADLIRTTDWNLSAALIYYRNRNEVESLGNAVESGLNTDPNSGMQFEYWGNSLEQFRQYPNILAVGQPVNVYYGYKTDGIIQSLEEGIESGLTGDLAQPGEFKYLDMNGDGIIDTQDRTIIGDPNPDFSMSFELNLAYKNFDASIFLNGVFGHDVLNTQAFNQPGTIPLRWTPDNPTDEYPSLKDGRNTYFSDWWIEDGSFVRIQNLNVGYTFDLFEASSIRLFANASNLYTFTKFDGYDPEVGNNGIYWGGYPRLRKLTLGANITF
nr:TonB-dependent receptor [Rhodohalobacter sp. 614A]